MEFYNQSSSDEQTRHHAIKMHWIMVHWTLEAIVYVKWIKSYKFMLHRMAATMYQWLVFCTLLDTINKCIWKKYFLLSLIPLRLCFWIHSASFPLQAVCLRARARARACVCVCDLLLIDVSKVIWLQNYKQCTNMRNIRRKCKEKNVVLATNEMTSEHTSIICL